MSRNVSSNSQAQFSLITHKWDDNYDTCKEIYCYIDKHDFAYALSMAYVNSTI